MTNVNKIKIDRCKRCPAWDFSRYGYMNGSLIDYHYKLALSQFIVAFGFLGRPCFPIHNPINGIMKPLRDHSIICFRYGKLVGREVVVLPALAVKSKVL